MSQEKFAEFHLDIARRHAQAAAVSPGDGLRDWVECALHAYRALAQSRRSIELAAMTLASQSAGEIVARLIHQYPDGWPQGTVESDGIAFHIEFRPRSIPSRSPVKVRRASDISMKALDGRRYSHAGLGVPVAVLSAHRPDASDFLTPRPGAFRNLTAWIEPAGDSDDSAVRLVLADPKRVRAVSIDGRQVALASDTSAAYAWAMQLSELKHSGMWGLLGSQRVSRRAGVYLLEDFDPNKRPLVMIHGLGSQPLIWSHLSNAVWGNDDLRSRYQVWQVIYETDAPVLAARLRVQEYLDEAWHAIDPSGEARMRSGMVVVGHSLGGVVARLLCADSGDTLWDAAFATPSSALHGDPEDLHLMERIFHFTRYPGCARAIFLAAPHRGSPAAAVLLGRVAGDLVGRHVREVQALRRIALDNPGAVRRELREAFAHGRVNSIITLQPDHPVRRAVEQLMPADGFAFHTIAGVVPRHRVPTDGVVPLDSALIPGAASSLVVESGHRLHGNPRVVDEILRILRL